MFRTMSASCFGSDMTTTTPVFGTQPDQAGQTQFNTPGHSLFQSTTDPAEIPFWSQTFPLDMADGEPYVLTNAEVYASCPLARAGITNRLMAWRSLNLPGQPPGVERPLPQPYLMAAPLTPQAHASAMIVPPRVGEDKKTIRARCQSCFRALPINRNNDGVRCTKCFNEEKDLASTAAPATGWSASITKRSSFSTGPSLGELGDDDGLGTPITPVDGMQGHASSQKQVVTPLPRVAIDIGLAAHHLLYASVDEAQQYAIQPPVKDCMQVKVKAEDDDWTLAKGPYYDELCLRLLGAVCDPPAPLPPGAGEGEIKALNRCMKTLAEKLGSEDGIKMVQAHVMVAVSTAVAIHEFGIAKVALQDPRGFKPDFTLTCLARVQKMIEVVRHDPLCKSDLAKGVSIDKLARNPSEASNQKTRNLGGNKKKKDNLELAKGLQARQGDEGSVLLRATGKRVQSSDIAADQNIDPAVCGTQSRRVDPPFEPASFGGVSTQPGGSVVGSTGRKRAHPTDSSYDLETEEGFRSTRRRTTSVSHPSQQVQQPSYRQDLEFVHPQHGLSANGMVGSGDRQAVYGAQSGGNQSYGFRPPSESFTGGVQGVFRVEQSQNLFNSLTQGFAAPPAYRTPSGTPFIFNSPSSYAAPAEYGAASSFGGSSGLSNGSSHAGPSLYESYRRANSTGPLNGSFSLNTGEAVGGAQDSGGAFGDRYVAEGGAPFETDFDELEEFQYRDIIGGAEETQWTVHH
ncbi:uncharacterized protein LTR77_009260 [Saxophila tyrrhenica]|uniref:Uncharacterized protein n=1 Tax=Saxophila tyrrhenica TaxID=1690608 RepID=A0AAV9NYK0_9PEZI|nr:hypothetical protein LTR77_009260 [Saxophila tyrrhenica]